MKTVIEYWASLPAAKNVQFDVNTKKKENFFC